MDSDDQKVDKHYLECFLEKIEKFRGLNLSFYKSTLRIINVLMTILDLFYSKNLSWPILIIFKLCLKFDIINYF